MSPSRGVEVPAPGSWLLLGEAEVGRVGSWQLLSMTALPLSNELSRLRRVERHPQRRTASGTRVLCRCAHAGPAHVPGPEGACRPF